MVLVWHFRCQIIRKIQFMIKSNHKIDTLYGNPTQKVWGLKWCARTNLLFYTAKKKKIILKSYEFLQNVSRDFWFFINIKNTPFSKTIYYHILLNTGMEKWRKCTSQIFDYWNYITRYFYQSEELFTKCQKLWIH